MLKGYLYILIFCFYGSNLFAQQDSLLIRKKDSIKAIPQKMDILAPSKAAFYSAVFPGLGQIYNKKYWKAPVVWAGIGFGTFLYVDNNNKYDRYRTAFKLRRAGRIDEFPNLSDAGLQRAQEVFKKNRDLSLFVTLGLYVLNIVEANVDAHLPDKALDTNITFDPAFFSEPISNQPMFGASLTFNF